MSLTMSIGGKDITSFNDFTVNNDGAGNVTGTFEIPPSISVNPGDTISVGWDTGGSITTGVVTRTIHTTGTTSGTFSTLWPSTAGSTTIVTGTVWPVGWRRLTHEDEKLIEEFLIDSFARGFAKEQAA